MSTQAKRAEISCQLCGKTVQVNYRHQRQEYCLKCAKKLKGVGLRVEKEVTAQKTEAKAKAAKKKAKQPPRFKCPHCQTIFPCPTCEKDVSAKKSKKKGGAKNAK